MHQDDNDFEPWDDLVEYNPSGGHMNDHEDSIPPSIDSEPLINPVSGPNNPTNVNLIYGFSRTSFSSPAILANSNCQYLQLLNCLGL